MRCAGRPRRILGPRPRAHAEHEARRRGTALPAVVQRRGVRLEQPGGRAAGERSGLPAREEDAPGLGLPRGQPRGWSGQEAAQPHPRDQSQQPDRKGPLGLPHVPRPQSREPAGRAVGERRVDARTRALGREAAGARTEGLGAAPRGLRRGVARPGDGRPDERRSGQSLVGGQARSRIGDRGAEPAAWRRREAGAADAPAHSREQAGQERRQGDVDALHRGPPR